MGIVFHRCNTSSQVGKLDDADPIVVYLGGWHFHKIRKAHAPISITAGERSLECSAYQHLPRFGYVTDNP